MKNNDQINEKWTHYKIILKTLTKNVILLIDDGRGDKNDKEKKVYKATTSIVTEVIEFYFFYEEI